MKRVLVLSDLHIGSGQQKGLVNVYDDFREDDRFEQLLARYTTGKCADDEVHLVLNGDIFDLLKVPVNGKFPEAITERLAVTKLEQCLQGHPRVVDAIKALLAKPQNQITFQPGNHDMEFFFPGVQRAFSRAISGEEVHPRVRTISDTPFFELEGGVQFHHGHQFEAIHAMDFGKLFLTRGVSEPILNLPWGSLFILQVVNKLMNERPYLDKVMPFWPLFVGGLFFDTAFTLRMIGSSAYYFARARFNPLWWNKRPLEKVFRLARTELKLFEHLDQFAKRILKNPKVNAVFMGHTHSEMVRTYPRNKIYVNTGTWMPMINLSLSNLGRNTALHYGMLKYLPSGEPRVSLMRWRGRHIRAEEVIL